MKLEKVANQQLVCSALPVLLRVPCRKAPGLHDCFTSFVYALRSQLPVHLPGLLLSTPGGVSVGSYNVCVCMCVCVHVRIRQTGIVSANGHALGPQAIKNRLLCSTLGLMVPTFFWYHCIAVQNAHFERKIWENNIIHFGK